MDDFIFLSGVNQVLQLTPDNQGTNGVINSCYYLALGIEIGNEAEERSRIKMIASL
jgi:hypothetical protein